jgi:hypothetical protein
MQCTFPCAAVRFAFSAVSASQRQTVACRLALPAVSARCRTLHHRNATANRLASASAPAQLLRVAADGGVRCPSQRGHRGVQVQASRADVTMTGMGRLRGGSAIRSEGRRAAIRALAAAPLLLDVPAGALRWVCTGTADLLLCTHADAEDDGT